MKANVDDILAHEIIPGYRGRFILSERMTAAYWEIAAGAQMQEHSHPQEQIVNMQEGRFDLTVDGTVHRLNPGDVVVIPPDVPHSGMAITDCRILDVWSPVREDYRLAGHQ